MKTMHLKGLGDIPLANEKDWVTICWFLEADAPTFDPTEKDLTDYEYRIRPANLCFELQKRKKNV